MGGQVHEYIDSAELHAQLVDLLSRRELGHRPPLPHKTAQDSTRQHKTAQDSARQHKTLTPDSTTRARAHARARARGRLARAG